MYCGRRCAEQLLVCTGQTERHVLQETMWWELVCTGQTERHLLQEAMCWATVSPHIKDKRAFQFFNNYCFGLRNFRISGVSSTCIVSDFTTIYPMLPSAVCLIVLAVIEQNTRVVYTGGPISIIRQQATSPKTLAMLRIASRISALYKSTVRYRQRMY